MTPRWPRTAREVLCTSKIGAWGSASKRAPRLPASRPVRQSSCVRRVLAVRGNAVFFFGRADRRQRAGARCRSADDTWSASLWGKNLTDELVEAGAFVVSLSRTIGRTYLPPRTYGVTFDYNF